MAKVHIIPHTVCLRATMSAAAAMLFPLSLSVLPELRFEVVTFVLNMCAHDIRLLVHISAEHCSQLSDYFKQFYDFFIHLHFHLMWTVESVTHSIINHRSNYKNKILK